MDGPQAYLNFRIMKQISTYQDVNETYIKLWNCFYKYYFKKYTTLISRSLLLHLIQKVVTCKSSQRLIQANECRQKFELSRIIP